MTAPTTDNAGCFGVPRIKAGKAGEAFHLLQVLRWLQECYEITRVTALNDYLLPVLIGDNAPPLYVARAGGDAIPLIEKISWYASLRGECGPAEAVEELCQFWGNADVSDAEVADGGWCIAAWLLVSKEHATAAWGWKAGAVNPVAAARLLAAEDEIDSAGAGKKQPDKRKHPKWTAAALEEQKKHLKGRNKTYQLTQITGLPAREITRRLKAAREEAENSNRSQSGEGK